MRCQWVYGTSEKMIDFHDQEWGKLLHDEQKLFEILCLMIFQSGLKWQMILERRSVLKNLFCDFKIEQMKNFNNHDINEMFKVEKMIANRRKTQAVIHNARVLDELHSKGITLKDLVWGITDNQVIDNRWTKPEQIPYQNELSIKLASKMKEAGFVWIGARNMYAYLQTIGVINDHLMGCEYR